MIHLFEIDDNKLKKLHSANSVEQLAIWALRNNQLILAQTLADESELEENELRGLSKSKFPVYLYNDEQY